MLPIEVVSQDAELESAIERDTEALARLRWHWTLDESNPGRVAIKEYARQVARSPSTILVMVNGYAASLNDNTSSTSRTPGEKLTLSDHIGKARMSGETAAAAEAVARARGIRVRTASDPGSPHRNEVRRVRDIARQIAEEKGTSIEEEVSRVAEAVVRDEKADRETRERKARNSDLRVIQAEQQILIAKRAVGKAIKELEGTEIDDEGQQLLAEANSSLKAACALFDARITGKSGVDWDAELARISGEGR